MRKIIFKESVYEFLPNYNIVNNEIVLNDVEQELKNAFMEDFPGVENEREEVIVRRIKRYKRIVDKLKERYKNRCQICGFSFEKEKGEGYSEAHHIVRLADDGSQDEDNVLILCANHHRMLHYAKEVNYCIENNLLQGVKINSEYFKLNKV